ncbi:hypothetical protein [Neptunomonas antarctica]|uniref:Uncharacterized protein n=1 Tax=Neptunomonas antarctica TaxID=619304 RepID=A0A1N7J5U1_9GAMM|nr:hypothetical protein [Neptunomonas antarctica]SIS44606.1 hypothetical protein SAMN05421760_101646 [Neptunomonas antarctica]
MKNPKYSLFRRFCADSCKKRVVTHSDYMQAVDMYLEISRSGDTSLRKIHYRWVQLLSLKFRRTSFMAPNPTQYPRSVFMALKSHSAISSRIDAKVIQDYNSVGGRWTAHPVRRFFRAFQRDFFGYPKKHNTQQLAPATARASVSSYLTAGPSHSKKGCSL